MAWSCLISLFLYHSIIITNGDVDTEHCQFTKVLSTCRLPAHYGAHVDLVYYRKLVEASGVPVLGTGNVSSAALVEAARLIRRMLEQAPSMYIDQITTRHDRVVILGRNEKLQDLPEFRNGIGDDRKMRELRGYNSMGVVVCAEENLLCNEKDDYEGYNVCMHEFAHSLDASFTKVDPTYKRSVVTAYREAMRDGLWANTYAASDPAEYFAELSVAWFDASSKSVVPGSFNGIWKREMVKNYDPTVSQLMNRIYGDGPWKYDCGDICPGPYLQDFNC